MEVFAIINGRSGLARVRTVHGETHGIRWTGVRLDLIKEIEPEELPKELQEFVGVEPPMSTSPNPADWARGWVFYPARGVEIVTELQLGDGWAEAFQTEGRNR